MQNFLIHRSRSFPEFAKKDHLEFIGNECIAGAGHHIESCQQTVPEAITAFLEGENFEDVLRCAVSLSGDSDTLTAIAGSIAEGFYGIPDEISKMIVPKLSDFLMGTLTKWEIWRHNA